VTIEKVYPSGAWRISDMREGYRVTRVYYGYTQREAIKEFKVDMKALANGQHTTK
jgi:hypothetical protein